MVLRGLSSAAMSPAVGEGMPVLDKMTGYRWRLGPVMSAQTSDAWRVETGSAQFGRGGANRQAGKETRRCSLLLHHGGIDLASAKWPTGLAVCTP